MGIEPMSKSFSKVLSPSAAWDQILFTIRYSNKR